MAGQQGCTPLSHHLALGLAFSHPQASAQAETPRAAGVQRWGKKGRARQQQQGPHVYAVRNDPPGPIAGDVLWPTAALTKAGTGNQEVGHSLRVIFFGGVLDMVENWEAGAERGRATLLRDQLGALLQQPLQSLHEVRHAVVLGNVLKDSDLLHEDLRKNQSP